MAGVPLVHDHSALLAAGGALLRALPRGGSGPAGAQRAPPRRESHDGGPSRRRPGDGVASLGSVGPPVAQPAGHGGGGDRRAPARRTGPTPPPLSPGRRGPPGP